MVLLIAMWVASQLFYIEYRSGSSSITIWVGAVTLTFNAPNSNDSNGLKWHFAPVKGDIHNAWWIGTLVAPSGTYIGIPIWLIAFPFALIAVIARFSRAKQDPNLCRECDYDLRCNVSGVCPECGCAKESSGKGDCDMSP